MRVLFAADLHGSTRVWVKLLEMSRTTEAHLVICAGDLTSKLLLPIVRTAERKYEVVHHDRKLTIEGKSDLRAIEDHLAAEGVYSCVMDNERISHLLEHSDAVERTIRNLAEERLHAWIEMLPSHVGTKPPRFFLSAGNDDPCTIDEVIQSVEDDTFIGIGEGVREVLGLTIVTVAEVNPTPWNTARELPEHELAQLIELRCQEVSAMGKAVFNFHSPPFGTKLDFAPKLDAKAKPQRGAGGAQQTHVGSTAVRKAIDRYQPLLGLHGHIHESPGLQHLGRTVVANPGSEYSYGILHAFMFEIDDERVADFQRLEA